MGFQVSPSTDQEVGGYSDDPTRPNCLTRAAQALMAGRYQKALPYSVEALLLYAICIYREREDPGTDAWMIMGICVRLAMKMGYHRDPRHLASISPFEGEMRRRAWMFIETFDLLLSFQAGLPAIIHEEECDTEPPSNLFDTDLHEDCKVRPPSRPPTDPTMMLYYCYKSRLAKTLRRVIRLSLSVKPPLYTETMRLDSELRDFHSNIPPSLRVRPLGSSVTDETYVFLNRLNVELMYLKSLCLLQRN